METPKSSDTLGERLESEFSQDQSPCEKSLEEIYGLSILTEDCPESVPSFVDSLGGNGDGFHSDSKADLSANGISLCVDIGPVNGHGQCDDFKHLEKHVSVGNNPIQEGADSLNSDLLLQNGNTNAKTDHGVEGFCVGDFVWAETISQLWWPGVIVDPSNAPEDGSERRGLLVRHYGTGSLVWSANLKPFLECFVQMSKQADSRGFVAAVEKAVGEFGHLIRKDFTCYCYGKEAKEKIGDLGELSVTRFEPKSFLAFIKHISLDVSLPSKIDCSIIENRLLAFYKATGQKQIPVHQLKPSSPKAKDIARSELSLGSEGEVPEKKGEETVMHVVEAANGEKTADRNLRERRKRSRYLSPPYVDLLEGRKSSPLSGENETEDSKTVPLEGVDTKSVHPVVASPVVDSKKLRKRRSRKPSVASQKMVVINASSGEVLSELRLAALDCLYPNQSKCFDSVERFLLRYRDMVFHDSVGFCGNEVKTGPELGVQTGTKNVTELPPLPDAKMKESSLLGSPIEGTVSSSGPVMIDFQNSGVFAPGPALNSGSTLRNYAAEMGILSPGGKPGPKKRGRKRKAPEPTASSGAVMIDFQNLGAFAPGPALNSDCTQRNSEAEMGILSPGGKPEPKKRGRKRKAPETAASFVPELNGNPVEGKPQRKRGRKKKIYAEGGSTPSVNFLYNNNVNSNMGESPGTALLLKFEPGHPLPLKEDLVSAFRGFGPLKESETRALEESENSAQVVFVSSANAGEALRSLEKCSPFGPGLINYQLNPLSGSSQATGGLRRSIELPLLKPQQGEKPDIASIKKNLEMMTSVLEKAGNNLSPDMRLKLETDIKALLEKVNTRDGSSSSSQ